MANKIFESHNIDLDFLLKEIKLGRIGLPDLQRPFVWANEKVRNLYDSMLKGFPIGYIMLWESPENYSSKMEDIGLNDKELKSPKSLIIDGQQRLTALVATMYGIKVKDKNFKERNIKICYNPLREVDRFENWSVAYERNPEWISDLSVVFLAKEQNTLSKLRRAYIKRLNESYEKNNLPILTDEQEDLIENRLNELLGLEKYPVPVLDIYRSASEEEVAEIFVRVNSGGQKLNENDFILTLLSVYAKEDRDKIDSFCEKSHIPAAGTSYNNLLIVEPVHLVRMIVGVGFKRARLRYAYMLLRGKDLDSGIVTEERRNENLAVFGAALSTVIDLNNWHAFLNIIAQGGYVSSKLIAADNSIVFSYILYLIAKYEFHLENQKLSSLFRRWFFMVSVTSYFSSSVETDAEKLFADMKTLKNADELAAYLSSVIDSRLTEDYFAITLPKDLESSAAISPHWYAYLASQNILNIPMLFSTSHLAMFLLPGAHGNKNAVEKHHIFPKNYLTSIGIDSDRERNQIANYTYLDYQTNIAISDRPPADYINEFIQKLGEDNFKLMCENHALPQGFDTMEYNEFLKVRRVLMAKLIQKAYKRLCQG